MTHRLKITPAIPVDERHKISDFIKSLGYLISGQGQDTDNSECDITFYKPILQGEIGAGLEPVTGPVTENDFPDVEDKPEEEASVDAIEKKLLKEIFKETHQGKRSLLVDEYSVFKATTRF